MNCFAGENNLWFTGGTVAIAAIKEKYLNRGFTSGLMTTKQSFHASKVVIRAARKDNGSENFYQRIQRPSEDRSVDEYNDLLQK